MFQVLRQLVSDAREAVGEQFEYRELLYQMTRRDLLLRYKQAVMGFAWALFMPLTNTAVFSVIFTRIAPLQLDVPYPLFAYLGLLAWNFTASALRFSVTSLTSNVNLVTKVYFPREIFPLSAILVTIVDTLVGTVILVGLMGYYRYWPSTALSMSSAPIMWYGTSRNLRPSVQLWRATTSANSGVALACVLPDSSRFSTAMKWLLPAPKDACR